MQLSVQVQTAKGGKVAGNPCPEHPLSISSRSLKQPSSYIKCSKLSQCFTCLCQKELLEHSENSTQHVAWYPGEWKLQTVGEDAIIPLCCTVSKLHSRYEILGKSSKSVAGSNNNGRHRNFECFKLFFLTAKINIYFHFLWSEQDSPETWNSFKTFCPATSPMESLFSIATTSCCWSVQSSNLLARSLASIASKLLYRTRTSAQTTQAFAEERQREEVIRLLTV